MTDEKPEHSDEELLAKVNSTTVSAELLGEMMELHAAVLPGNSAAELEAFERCSNEVLLNNGRCGDFSFGAIVNLRRIVLGSLLEKHAIGDWTLPAEKPDVQKVHIDLLRAATQEPVIMGTDGLSTFDA